MSENTLPNYEVVPLRSNEIAVAVVQSPFGTVDSQNPKKKIKENVEHMLWLIDQAQTNTYDPYSSAWGFHKDLIVFHECPITGLNTKWSLEEELRIAIDVPGEETELIGKKAKEYNCYIALGLWPAKDKDWPGHFLYMGILIGPSGEIILKNWRRRNMTGLEFSTSVYDVLDEYVKKYGWDAVFPIARTDIGNIAFQPCLFEPEMTRALAIKGVEILIRYMTAGASIRFDVPVLCATNKIYGIFVNQSISPKNEAFFEDMGAGGSAVFDESGRMIAEASSANETIVETMIPIAAFRKRHSIPVIRKELFERVYAEYVPKYQPNTFLQYLPKDIPDSIEHYRKIARW